MTLRTISRVTAISVAALSLFLSACGNKPSSEPAPAPSTAATPPSTGDYKISLRVEPDPPAGAKENALHVTLQDGTGKAVTDAQVHVTFTMPAMPEMKMPEMKNATDLSWNGSDYSGTIQVTMAGGWNVDVEAKRGDAVLTEYQTKLTAH